MERAIPAADPAQAEPAPVPPNTLARGEGGHDRPLLLARPGPRAPRKILARSAAAAGSGARAGSGQARCAVVVARDDAGIRARLRLDHIHRMERITGICFWFVLPPGLCRTQFSSTRARHLIRISFIIMDSCLNSWGIL
jgi:hypothetical protein